MVSVLGFLGRVVYACVFGLLVGTLCRVKGAGPAGGMMEGGVQEISPCCPCVQNGGGGPCRLYGVPLIVPAVVDVGVDGRQFVHPGGVGEVAGVRDLGGVVLAGGGVWDDVLGSPFVAGGFPLRVQFEWGVEWFWRWGFLLTFCLWRDVALHKVTWAPGLQGPHLGGCGCCGLEEGGAVGVQLGGSGGSFWG